MDNLAKNARKTKIIMELRRRIEANQFHIRTNGKYGWPRAQRKLELAKQSLEINRARLLKIRAVTQIDFLPK